MYTVYNSVGKDFIGGSTAMDELQPNSRTVTSKGSTILSL